MSFENTVLGNLLHNEEFARKVIPFLKEDYFSDLSDRTIYSLINDYVNKYNAFPSKEALLIDLSNKDGINEVTFKECKEKVGTYTKSEDKDRQWLVDQTEKWCQDRAI